MSFRIILISLIILIFSQFSMSAQKEWKSLELAPVIDTRQEIKLTPAGWVAQKDDMPCQVSNITVYDGRPKLKASLVPDSEERQKAGKKLISKWKLMPSTSEGIWITVSYSSTMIVLARQLPQGTTEIRVTYDTSVTISGQNEITRVEYR